MTGERPSSSALPIVDLGLTIVVTPLSARALLLEVERERPGGSSAIVVLPEPEPEAP